MSTKDINIRKLVYQLRHKVMQRDFGIVLVGLAFALYFGWNALGMLDRNYSLQKQLDSKVKELELAKLETTSLELEKKFYQTKEYQELVAKEALGLARQGEHLLILPPNTDVAKAKDKATSLNEVSISKLSNFDQWVNLLSGKNVRRVITN